MDNPGEILRLCRLCLVKDQVNIPIFEEQGDIRQTFLKIRSCLPVKVSRDDKLPKKICGGCSNKLDLFYEFWSSTANSEKTLQSWLGQEEEDDKMQEITKPVEALVKEESEALEDGHAHDQSFDEATKDEAEAPPAKRARRTAAVKAQINISHDSDEDEDVDGAEPITKIEDESDDSDGEEKDPSYTEVPGTSADDQAGPSGLGKDGVEAPNTYETILKLFTGTENTHLSDTNGIFRCGDCILDFPFKPNLVKHIRKKHPGKSYFKCKGCRRDFDEEVYFFSRAHLSFHMEQVHESEEKKSEANNPVTCFICDRELKSLEGLKSHLIYHHISQHLMICYICNKTCKNTMHLKGHIWKEHCEKMLYLCGTCGQSCSSKGCLNDHIVEDHYINRKIKCKLCRPLNIHTMFVDEMFLRGHLIASHSPQQLSKTSKEHLPHSTEFVCGECGQVMESLARIKLHIYLDHYTPWSKHLSCEHCKHHIRWYFVSTAALEKHISNDHPQLVNRNEDNGLGVDLALADEVVPLSERDVEGVASFDDVHDGEEEVLILTIEDTEEESENEEDAVVDEDFTVEDIGDCKEDSVDSTEKLSNDHVKIEWIVDNNFEKNLRTGFACVDDENTESDNISLWKG
ncbi:GDNF-inducible zinc finger protein 1-like isoform X17 [Euwallacea similis]|uniref:GDNF-inducible zinc finger protein 1-like isoform X17 n=1 Tax=Euwallacea similis TaxID=1736056 RepID=UPI00344FCEB4